MPPPFYIDKVNDRKYGKQYYLIGPDGLVWHRSWSRGPRLRRLTRSLTRAFELGKKASEL